MLSNLPVMRSISDSALLQISDHDKRGSMHPGLYPPPTLTLLLQFKTNGQGTNVYVIPERDSAMLYWAVVFFIIAIVAAIFGFNGLAHDTTYIAKILAVIGIILALVTFLFHRRSAQR